uniref:Uncharacterized protein n=1 Tax=Tanacetum cinerariifolium TaxID=118510 RepID=A0A6L2NR19_TANCI|nr:hypothetical protein [Tanacetum cinerariifolium]
MLESKAYQTYYAFASGEKALKPKYIRKKADSDTSPKKKPVQATKGTRLKSKAKVPDEQQQKTSGTYEGTNTIPGVPDVPPYESKSDKESWGDGEDKDDNNDDGDIDDDGESNDHDDDSDDERTKYDSDKIPNPDLTNVDQTEHKEEECDDEFYEEEEENINDEETMYDEEDNEVTKELYYDVNVKLGNEDTDMTIADQGASDQQNVSQESRFEQDARVTLTPVIDTQKTGDPTQSSSFSFDFTSKLLNLDNPSLADNKIASLMDTTTQHATVIPEITSSFTITFHQRVSTLESKMSELKKTNHFVVAVSSISGIVDKYLASKMKEAVSVAVQLQTNKLKEEAQVENQEFLNQIEKYVTKSLGAKVLVRSTNQPRTAYAVAASLSEFELKKILIDKMKANKSINRSDNQKNLYHALVESYNFDKDIISSYGDVVLVKRGRDDQDQDEDPSARSDQRTKRSKSGKDTESSKDSRSKENMSSSTSKDASQYQHKSSDKFVHAEEPNHTVEDSCMQQDQEFIMRDNDEQPADKEVTKADWFKELERPLTPDPDWSKRRQVDFRPPQTWISQAELAEEPPTSFDEFNNTSSDFSTFVMNRLKILNLTQEILVKENQEKDKNRIKTGQEREACRSQEKFKVVAVKRGRKTEEYKKRMAENAYTYQKLFNFKEKKKREGPEMKFFQNINHRG